MKKLIQSAACVAVAACALALCQTAAISSNDSVMLLAEAGPSVNHAVLEGAKTSSIETVAYDQKGKASQQVFHLPEQDIVVFKNQGFQLITQGDVREGIELLKRETEAHPAS